jgi:phenylalanine-4-hydroxylase
MKIWEDSNGKSLICNIEYADPDTAIDFFENGLKMAKKAKETKKHVRVWMDLTNPKPGKKQRRFCQFFIDKMDFTLRKKKLAEFREMRRQLESENNVAW